MSLFNIDLLTPLPDEFIRHALPTKKEAEAVQDEFEVVYTQAKREFLTNSELTSIASGSAFVFDSESYVNYWVVAFKHCDSGKYIVFEDAAPDNAKLNWLMTTFLIVGFNSKSYDVPMVTLALHGFNPKQLKQASNAIIFGQLLPYQIEQHYKVNLIKTNHIDLIEVMPLKGSLKLYSARLHCKRIQDLPISHDAVLTEDQKTVIRDYCLNDLDNTETSFKFIYPQLDLRYTLSNQYKVDLRSKSDAQIAEAVIAAELHRLTGIKPERPKNYSTYFFYQVPEFIKFNNHVLQDVLQLIRDTPFQVGENGEVQMPEAISNLSIPFGQCVYRLGMGGLHSSEKTISYKASKDLLLIDRDVASYYPQIIINQQLHPKHLGKPYLEVYKSIVRRRLDNKKIVKRCKEDIDILKGNSNALSKDAAKKHYLVLVAEMEHAKTQVDSLKITVNGLFGKFGNKWSIVYSPDVLIQITVSGQLCLLKLIEMIEETQVPVISANTDGVVVACPATLEPALERTIKEWEQFTHFDTEETRYSAIYSRDVNNYIAVKEDGEIKVKGSYSERGSSGDTILSKNPETLICNDAATAFVGKGTPVETTIRECKDIRRFVVVRNVKGGATKSGKYLGKTVRWYYSTKMQGDIRYVTSGNKVPNSDGAMPLMELPEGKELPDDLDYRRYILIAQSILVEIGAIAPTQSLQGSLFDYSEPEPESC